MGILDNKLVEEQLKTGEEAYLHEVEECDNYRYIFKSGVEWAESQIKEKIESTISVDGDELTDGELLDLILDFLKIDYNEKCK